jgi:hypothetical protein
MWEDLGSNGWLSKHYEGTSFRLLQMSSWT